MSEEYWKNVKHLNYLWSVVLEQNFSRASLEDYNSFEESLDKTKIKAKVKT